MNPTAVAQSYLGRLHARIREARAHSDELFEIVRPEALYDRPIPERHRIIFYLGHLEAFDWNLLLEPLGLASFDPDFDRLFAFGIDPVEGGLPDDEPKDWPSLEKCGATQRNCAVHWTMHCVRPMRKTPALSGSNTAACSMSPSNIA